MWNSLPATVVSANNVNTFKNRLYRFRTNQELIYNCQSTLTGIGNINSADNFDDTIFSFILCCVHLIGIEASAYAVFLALLCFG